MVFHSARQPWVLSVLLCAGFLSGCTPKAEANASSDPVAGATGDAKNHRVLVRTSYLPGVPLLIRVDALTAAGKVDKVPWDETAYISVVDGNVTLSGDTVEIVHGRGSQLVVLSGSGDATLAIEYQGEMSLHPLRSLENTAQDGFSGTLEYTLTEWSGIVNVTDTITVPVGKTLRILPGTLVLFEGEPEGSREGVGLTIRGTLEILGEDSDPVTLTTADPSEGWGEIRLEEAAASVIENAMITRGGLAPTEVGHSKTGPVLRLFSTDLIVSGGAITDLHGKIMWCEYSQLMMSDMHLSRATMGPEIRDTPVVMEDVWITEMRGPNDNDGLYLRDFSEGVEGLIKGVTIAHGDDDALDTNFSTAVYEDVILRGFADKAASLIGTHHFINALIVENAAGIVAKNPSTITVENATIFGNSEKGLFAEFTEGRKDELFLTVKNSIIWGNGDDALANRSDDDIILSYSNIGEPWPGEGVIQADPLFVDAPAGDLHLQPGSPSLNAGDPDSEMDVDGTRADQGFYRTADDDGDAYNEAEGDCDDDNANIYPGAEEGVNGADDDCDGIIDEGAPTPTEVPSTATPETPTPTEATPTQEGQTPSQPPDETATELPGTPTASMTATPMDTPTATATPTQPSGTPTATEPVATPTSPPDEGGCNCSAAGNKPSSLFGIFTLILMGIVRRGSRETK